MQPPLTLDEIIKISVYSIDLPLYHINFLDTLGVTTKNHFEVSQTVADLSPAMTCGPCEIRRTDAKCKVVNQCIQNLTESQQINNT